MIWVFRKNLYFYFSGSFAYRPVTIANGVMFGAALGTPLGALLALEATTGKVLWQYKVNSTLAGQVSVLKGWLCIDG